MKRNDDPWRLLMFAVVRSAFLDRDYSFFLSEWGRTLCEETDIRVLKKFKEKYAEQIKRQNCFRDRTCS